MLVYSKEVNYVGRNGCGRQKGLEIELIADYVNFEPVNSKGNVANCRLQVPAEDLDQLIKGLQELRAQHKAKQASKKPVVHVKGCELGDNHKDCPACNSAN